jgi:hypothetical protein
MNLDEQVLVASSLLAGWAAFQIPFTVAENPLNGAYTC